MNSKDRIEKISGWIKEYVENHKIENLINLYGIESPGLTSSLAIANYIMERL